MMILYQGIKYSSTVHLLFLPVYTIPMVYRIPGIRVRIESQSDCVRQPHMNTHVFYVLVQ